MGTNSIPEQDRVPDSIAAALIRLIAAGRDHCALVKQLEVVQGERDEAILTAWALGIGASAIAEKTGITAARVQQIVDVAGAPARHQNRQLSRTLEAMVPVPEAHLVRDLVDDHDRNQIAVWTMAQWGRRTWTPEQMALALSEHRWPAERDVEARLDELVQLRRIHRVGDQLYQLHSP